MAAFNFEGNTYFFANGKWLDCNSCQLSAELVKKLNETYSLDEIEAKEEARNAVQRKVQKENRQNRKWYNYPSYSYMYDIDYESGYPIKKVKKKHQNIYEVNETPIKMAKALTEEQKRALEVLESGENVFLTGGAGTGKSFVLNEFIKRVKDKNVIVCAPTGIAAINVSGSTLHRVFHIPTRPVGPKEYCKNPTEALIKADIIIIDEISMCRFDIFEYVAKSIKNAEKIRRFRSDQYATSKRNASKIFKEKQLIVVGDFYQLPPVIVDRDKLILEKYWDVNEYENGFAFQAKSWKDFNFKNIVLKEVHRQKGKDKFIKNLNLIREGNSDGIIWFNENAAKIPYDNSIFLCGTNSKANAINFQKSEELEGEAVTYVSKVNGQVQESDKMTLDNLQLKVGMQVMMLVNNNDEGYKNGSIGRVISLKDKSVKVKLNSGKEVEVEPYTWQIYDYSVIEDKLEKIILGTFEQLPLKIAYAITIHKSQGQTYSSANIFPQCFVPGQLYVALSRVQNIDGMCLLQKISNKSLLTSEIVKKFYAEIEVKE